MAAKEDESQIAATTDPGRESSWVKSKIYPPKTDTAARRNAFLFQVHMNALRDSTDPRIQGSTANVSLPIQPRFAVFEAVLRPRWWTKYKTMMKTWK